MLSAASLLGSICFNPRACVRRDLTDYRLLPQIIENGEVWQVPGQGERLIFITLGGVRYRAALKRTMDGSKNYLVTLFRIGKGSAVPKGAVKVR